MVLVLYLRLNERSQLTVEEAWGGIKEFTEYLNEHQSWMFRQTERRFVHGKWITYPPSVIFLCDRIKLVLSVPRFDLNGKEAYYYYRILTVRTPNREDRTDAMTATEVSERVEVQQNMPDSRLTVIRPVEQPATASTIAAATKATIQSTPAKILTEKPKPTVPAAAPLSRDDDRQRFLISPTCPQCSTVLTAYRGLFCHRCGVRLPTDTAVHPEVVVAIKRKDYDRLATHLKQKVNVAWSQLLRGRKVDKSLNSMGQALFIITVQDERRTSSQTDEQRLDSILTETNIGRVATDPYELREAHKMMDRKPSAQPV
jgi:hypothetical protein